MNCYVEGCRNGALRDMEGSCVLCVRRLCRVHALQPAHGCPDPFEQWELYQAMDLEARERELSALVEKIDFSALTKVIAALRPSVEAALDPMFLGSPSEIDHGRLLMGGLNVHVPVTFSDGVEWLIRIPRDKITQPSRSVHQEMLRSEISTLRYLKSAGLPVPTVFAAKTTEDNGVHTPYIILERIQGRPMMFASPSEDQKARQIAQTAAHFVQLAALPAFSALGYLRDETGSIGPVLDPDFLRTTSDGQLVPSDAFRSSRDFYRDRISGVLRDIEDGLRYPVRALDAYLMHLQLLDIVDILWPAHEPGSGPFFIRHPDDKGDNHLVDENCDIVSIIDWERTRTRSPQEAFVGPTFMIDNNAFFAGRNELSADETALVAALEGLHRPDLAAYVRDGKKYQRLEFCVALRLADSACWGFFRGLMTACGLPDWTSWDAWKSHALGPEVYGSVPAVLELVKAGCL